MPAPLPAGAGAVPEPVRSSHHTLIVTAQDHGSSLMLRQGKTLRVVLSGNASTGYGPGLSMLPAQAAD